jgi:hypothetical protein
LTEETPNKPTISLPPIREFNDRATLRLLEDPGNLRDLLQICEPELAPRLDFSRAQRINRSFIPADLQKEESDLIYRVPLRDSGPGSHEIWIYTLLEHQSKPDSAMALRLYLYIGELWDAQRREWEDAGTPANQRRLHLIVPLVFYTGRENWKTPINLSDMIDVPDGFERFVPSWETLFLPLHRSSEAVLTQFSSAIGWALRVLQAEQEPLIEMERVLTEAMSSLEGLSEEQSGQWLRVAWYLVLLVFHRRSSEESTALIELIQDQARESRFRDREEWQQMEQTYAESSRSEERTLG